MLNLDHGHTAVSTDKSRSWVLTGLEGILVVAQHCGDKALNLRVACAASRDEGSPI